ncbi:MAG TPA: hypothetical protein VN181_15880 [Thermoanaerobaculia bacterium]|nr:hypothetical protein [Thermoanaerobaculia bacterium]
MSELVTATINDLRWGRQTWRVLATLAIPSFLVALAVALVRQPF